MDRWEDGLFTRWVTLEGNQTWSSGAAVRSAVAGKACELNPGIY